MRLSSVRKRRVARFGMVRYVMACYGRVRFEFVKVGYGTAFLAGRGCFGVLSSVRKRR